jgi:hypothetical protein
MVPMDEGACGYFRVREPARIAADRGVDVTLMQDPAMYADRYRGVPMRRGWDPVGKCDVILQLLFDADVVVIQRPLYQPMWAIAMAAKRQGMTVVVELDDNLHQLHARNHMARNVDPRIQPLHNIEWAQKTIDLADMLIVSTPAIARQYGVEKSVVVRNYLPAHILPLAPDLSPARDVLGWTGHLGVHPEDLQTTGGGLRNLRRPFTVVGGAEGVAAALAVPENKVRLGCTWQPDIPTYWAAVAATIGVGVAPLQHSVFNQAKSALKIMEYNALGIPYVASPSAEYLWYTRRSRGGLIAERRGQWERYTRRLLTDDALYEDLRAAGLAWAAANTLEAHIDEHINAWERAHDLGRRNRRHPDGGGAAAAAAGGGARVGRRPNQPGRAAHHRGRPAASRRTAH